MSVALTAPGVYVQEIPSGNRSITGVATSITAFVGGAPRGPVGAPTLCEGFGDYERLFGGLHVDSPMGQSVRHFFLNGGTQALIVRVAGTGAGITLVAAAGLAGAASFTATVASATATTFDLTITGYDAAGAAITGAAAGPTAINLATTPEATIEAMAGAGDPLVTVTGTLPTASPPVGTWSSAPNGSGVQSTVVGPAAITAAATLATGFRLVAADPGVWGNQLVWEASDTDAPTGTFHLTLTETDASGNPVRQEVHYAVTLDTTASRSLDLVLEGRSALARLEVGTGAVASIPTLATEMAFVGGTDGSPPSTAELTGSDVSRTGIYALRNADLFNLLCIPLASWALATGNDTTLWTEALALCEEERAFLVMDPPTEWGTATDATGGASTFTLRSDNAALYYPRIKAADPLQEGRAGEFPPCGVVAGIMARTDAQRGIWKAPAGIDAVARGVLALTTPLTDGQQGILNDYGVDAFRTFPVYGTVLWGARTLNGANVLASDWKYVPVRRLALYLEESLFRGTQWAVFEPNHEVLWSELRLSIGSFLHSLFRQGAFAGTTPRQAYFVKCDRETTTQADIDLGVVNVVIGFAPLKPAEFVILKLQQLVAQAG